MGAVAILYFFLYFMVAKVKFYKSNFKFEGNHLEKSVDELSVLVMNNLTFRRYIMVYLFRFAKFLFAIKMSMFRHFVLFFGSQLPYVEPSKPQ